MALILVKFATKIFVTHSANNTAPRVINKFSRDNVSLSQWHEGQQL